MERLTEVENGTAMVKGCGSNCKYGFEYCRKEDWENCKTIDDVIDKLAEYENLEEQGLLLRLPCKVGTKVYAINRIVDYGEVGDEAKYSYYIIEREFQIYMMMDYGKLVFGKTVFLTQSEAEQKLKEMERK